MFKFKKETIFSKLEAMDSYESDNLPETGGVLAVWGSPSSGKTIIASKIASELASQRKNVVLLLCDSTAPMISCVVPQTDLEVEKSLGSILAVPTVNVNVIKYNMMTCRRNSYLSIIGMLSGENEYTYAPYTQAQAEQLLDGLREIAPYIIVDCSSYIANDVLSAIALKEADDVLRVINCDLKSISYITSQLPLLQNSGFDLDRQIKVVNNIKLNHGVEQMAGTLGTMRYKIPHTPELEEQFLKGDLLSELQSKNSRMFKGEIKEIIKEVFSC